MNCVNIIGEMVKADEEKSEIKWKLEEIRKMRDAFRIDFSRVTSMIDRDKLSNIEIERENQKYQIIAKLSFDLFMDYEYYREFPIKKDSLFTNCAEELEKLGYELRESAEWVNVRRPNIDTIIDQIFLSNLCQSILMRCVCCDAITRDYQTVCDNCLNESNEKIIKVIIDKDNNDIDKRKCESLFPANQSFCGADCGIKQAMIDERMVENCLFGRNSDWICQYRLCGANNNDSNIYCQSCGIYRSPILIIGAPIWRCKGHIRDQIWVCWKCELINEIDNNVCHNCGVSMKKPSEAVVNNQSKQSKESDFHNNKMDNQSNIILHSKWRCESCKLINDVSCSRCQDCRVERMTPWICSRCSKRIDNLMERCDTCGVLREKTYCVKCGWRVSIMDGLCKSCVIIRESDGTCFYQLCGYRNNVDDDYCRRCGLHRYGHLECGAPINRMIGDKCEHVWVCSDCGEINKWKDKLCQNVIKSPSVAGVRFYSNYCWSRRDKFFKWCEPCGYKYRTNEFACVKCKQRL